MEKLNLPIIVEMDEDGYYVASCPLFKGWHSYGETVDQALENMKEIIGKCLAETDLKALNKFMGIRNLGIPQNT